jgi:Na+/H+ antiporter NhaD/arsenite permease-like protein
MFIVVRAIEDTGLTTMFGNWLINLREVRVLEQSRWGQPAQQWANLINNVPMAVGMISALRHRARITGRPAWLCRRHNFWMRPRPESDHRGLFGNRALAIDLAPAEC